MQVHKEALPDVDRFLQMHGGYGLSHFRSEYEAILRNIGDYKELRPGLKVLEVGCGTGWFPVAMQLDGYDCEGVEISWQLKEKADQMARESGLESSGIRVGNIEEEDIGENRYDVIVCNSVFEHIENWRLALQRVHRALKPGGVFLFSSTNKFSFTSGEHWFPLYGWLPDGMRYGLRKMFQGPQIMKLGIDFNQFRYPLLRAEFEKLGFTTIHDRIDMKDPEQFTGVKRLVFRLAKASGLFKSLVLTFNPATLFTCVK